MRRRAAGRAERPFAALDGGKCFVVKLRRVHALVFEKPHSDAVGFLQKSHEDMLGADEALAGHTGKLGRAFDDACGTRRGFGQHAVERFARADAFADGFHDFFVGNAFGGKEVGGNRRSFI